MCLANLKKFRTFLDTSIRSCVNNLLNFLSAYGSSASYLPPPPAPSARYVQDLERRNADLATEVEALQRELSREKERYGQLAQLTQYHQSAPMPVPSALHNATWDSKYSWAP